MSNHVPGFASVFRLVLYFVCVFLLYFVSHFISYSRHMVYQDIHLMVFLFPCYLIIRAARDGTRTANGWDEDPYNISKIAAIVLTRLQQREIEMKYPNRGILVNAVSKNHGTVRDHFVFHCFRMFTTGLNYEAYAMLEKLKYQ